MQGTGKTLVVIGAIIAVIGLIALAIPVFTTQQTKDVAKIGDLKVQTTEEKTFVIPPIVAGGALLLGLVMVGAGYTRRG
jgi:hypothetical protein